MQVLEKWSIFVMINHEGTMSKMNDQFLPQEDRYDDLIVYRKSERICDVTDYFCKMFMYRVKDRTVDQMIQTARSGKQNNVEGTAASATSKETGINCSMSPWQVIRNCWRVHHRPPLLLITPYHY